MQEQILQLILDKVEEISVKQQRMNGELDKMNGEQQRMNGGLQELLERVTRLEEGQDTILKYIENAEDTLKTCNQDHEFIEKLKKVAGE